MSIDTKKVLLYGTGAIIAYNLYKKYKGRIKILPRKVRYPVYPKDYPDYREDK